MTESARLSEMPTTSGIVDNRSRRVGKFLKDRIAPGSDLSIVSAYFTIYAYAAMREVLENAGSLRFLYGEPRGVGAVDPDGDKVRSFMLNEDGGIDLKQILVQKPLARDCAAWIRDRVEIRTVKQANFLHGKLYHLAGEESAALVGSSNLTQRGLGFGGTPNIELNLEVGDPAEREALLRWFDELWTNETLTRDAKEEVLAALERLGRPYSPEFVYYKTLFHVFEDRLADQGDGLLQDIHLYDTEIWKALYEFQRHGATSAINRLLKHNGCIVADSVGLGKTWTALAVIKFFELRNERVLVLCPKRLKENWVRYTSWAAYRNNRFENDRLNYTVLAHTDLSRYEGLAGAIDLANFNWGAFDLVVIDESHNFRNEGRDRTDEEGNVVGRSRYNRLLEEVIKDSVKTKLLMLSATPVNTSLRDLRNQIYLMTEKRRDAFRETLGIGDIQTLFGVAERAFMQWERDSGKKDALIETLGADFLALLDSATIARSRVHIQRYYPQVHEEIGGFPERKKPKNLHPATDSEGALSYDDLYEQIGDFRLAVYSPSLYLKDASSLDAEKEAAPFDQRDRERSLVCMMRVNLLKRLESSVHSFTLTMGRIIGKMEGLDRRIEAWRDRRDAEEIEVLPDEEEEDEDFEVGKGRTYRFDELDVDRWQRDLREDLQNFRNLHRTAQQVTAARDAKLAELRKVLASKVDNPITDRDGVANRKALVFTTFADTAHYIYEDVKDLGRGARVALVCGGAGNRSTTGASKFIDILEQFAPRAQERKGHGDEIDILIATDCLSEGQNLQDCDLVVNYDIHWNPVRLMQRFGRIDRLGSRNRQVGMVNFWPTQDLDRYLDLKNRVEARMALADAAATGADDLLDASESTQSDPSESAQLELAFRDEQLKRLRDEILDFEDDGVAMSDLTLDDFIADLLQYIQNHLAELEAAPFGIYAVSGADDGVRPGAIFCLKQKTSADERTPNRLQPYFLVYVHDDGSVRYTFRQAQQCLALFQTLAAGHSNPSLALEDAFDKETEQGRRMEKYDRLLDAALRNIVGTFRNAELSQLFSQQRGARLTRKSEHDSFELVTWLVIRNA